MSLEDNKRVVMDYFDAVMAVDTAKLDSLIAEGATQWLMPGTPLSGTVERDQMVGGIQFLASVAAGPIVITPGIVTAEDDRVAVTATSNIPLKSGKTYANNYHMLFQLKDGKITHIKEYFDSAHVNETLVELVNATAE